MKITKTKGFSLAELMIALLVISVALAATAPTITKSILGSDTMWKTSVNNTGGEQSVDANTIFFNGPNVLIGTQRLPNFKRASRYFPDAISTSNFDFSPKTDKLVIMGNLADGESLASSHIAFYNQKGTADATYAGRLASDRYNLALGIGSLQSLVPNVAESKGIYNTAIGHYALFMNEEGSYNTALGYKAMQGASKDNKVDNYAPSNNIALGDHALQHVKGNNNIAIGSFAGRHLGGDNNLVIGVGAGYGLTGNDNLLINPLTGLHNMIAREHDILSGLIGHRDNTKYPVINQNDNFSIGVIDYALKNSSSKESEQKNNNYVNSSYVPPVIQGFTRTACSGSPCTDDNIVHAKGIIINTDKFNMRQNPTPTQAQSANTNGRVPEGKRIFSVHAVPGNKSETNSEGVAIDISSYNEELNPCEGSIFCLTKFEVTTASYWTDEVRSGLYPKNKYVKTSVFPVFRTPDDDDTYLAGTKQGQNPDPIYDLYIGTEKNITLKEANSRVLSKDSKYDNFATNQYYRTYKYFIDVGKEADSDGLSSKRWDDDAATGTTTRPIILTQKHSLNIRTVKTAVNFLEEFKETSTGIDKLRDIIKYDIDCIFANRNNTDPASQLSCGNPLNISGQCTTWDRIKLKDCSLICPYNSTTNTGDCPPPKPLYPGSSIMLNSLKQTIYNRCISNDGKPVVTGCTQNLLQCQDSTPSDARLKNISGDNTAGIKEINKLNVVNYTYKADKAKTPHVGVIAQDLKKVFPDAVKKGSDGYYRIRLEDMFYAMINSVQQLSDRKDDLNNLTVDYIDTPLSELQKQNADIKAQNELLKQKNAEMEKRLSKLETK